MPLTDTAIRNAKPAEKAIKLFDGQGLYVEIAPSGGKWWRIKYRIAGKEQRLSLGTYPTVGLKEARKKRDETRELLNAGVDPAANRKALKAVQIDRQANSFELVAREWITKQSIGISELSINRMRRRFEVDIFPFIGSRPIADITAPELLTVFRRIEKRGVAYTAHRARSECGRVLRYAMATGRTSQDVSVALRGREVLSPMKEQHLASITEPSEVGDLLRMFNGYQGSAVVRYALKLAPLVFVRPGELRKAEWANIDLDSAEWRYMVTKTNTPHIVPLSTQAVAILRELQPITGTGRYVFPGARSNGRPMSDNAILAAMRQMGIPAEKMSGHGFRAMARTILDEVLHVRPDYIEHQLAHAVRDPNGRAYNRTAHLPERKKMMQDWADYLDQLKAGDSGQGKNALTSSHQSQKTAKLNP